MDKWDNRAVATVNVWGEIVLYILAVLFPIAAYCFSSTLDPYTLHKVTFGGKTMEVATRTKERVVTFRYLGMPANIFEEKNGKIWFQCIPSGSPAAFSAIIRPASSEEIKLFRTFYKK